MTSFFFVCAAAGGIVLVLQLLGSMLGADHGASHDSPDLHVAGEGLNLFSLRALAAGIAFFGMGGLIGMSSPLGWLLAIPLALILGSGAMAGVAYATRAMLRMDDDGTVQIHGAVGISGTVYLGIPADRGGRGKVHVVLQNRIVELEATTRHDAPIPTGSRVLIVDVVGPDIVDVVPDPVPQLESSDAV